MRKLWARIARARSSASPAIRPTLTPGPGATSYCVTTGPTVRPALAPSTRNVCSVSISLWPICSICASPASPSSGGAGARRSMGGIRPASGTAAVGQQQHASHTQPRGPPGGQAAEPLERRERPPDAEQRQQQGADAEHAPQLRSDGAAPAPREGKPQQGQSEEQPDDEGADPDQLLARLPVHVMRRSA